MAPLAPVYDGFLVHSRFGPPPRWTGDPCSTPTPSAPPEPAVPQRRVHSGDRRHHRDRPARWRTPPTDTAPPTVFGDDDGIVRGGVRTPCMEVPLAATSGLNSQTDRMSALFWAGTPFDTAHLAHRYPGGPTRYLAEFTAALHHTISARFILSTDRQEILELATITARGQFDPK